ncbi:MAG: hypothetical protein ACFCGT_09305 [Sandaracinaceae bacterium]
MPRRLPLAAALLVAAWVTGCGVDAPLGQGETCFRAAQCAAGLACVAGMCTTDLSGLEGGVPRVPADGGQRLDMGEDRDLGVAVDAGPDLGLDAGTVPVDEGPPPVDEGPRRDEGAPPVDEGPPALDQGPAAVDAGP